MALLGRLYAHSIPLNFHAEGTLFNRFRELQLACIFPCMAGCLTGLLQDDVVQLYAWELHAMQLQ